MFYHVEFEKKTGKKVSAETWREYQKFVDIEADTAVAGISIELFHIHKDPDVLVLSAMLLTMKTLVYKDEDLTLPILFTWIKLNYPQHYVKLEDALIKWINTTVDEDNREKLLTQIRQSSRVRDIDKLCHINEDDDMLSRAGVVDNNWTMLLLTGDTKYIDNIESMRGRFGFMIDNAINWSSNSLARMIPVVYEYYHALGKM